MSTTSSVQLARFLNGSNVSNSVVLQGSLTGVLLQYTNACEMKLQASFDNTVWWDVTTVTGTLGAPIADTTDRKFLTVPHTLYLTGTLFRIISTTSATAQIDCGLVTSNT